jgi:hypothetical protein
MYDNCNQNMLLCYIMWHVVYNTYICIMIYLPSLSTFSTYLPTYLIIKHYLQPIYQCFIKHSQGKVDGYNLFMVGCKGGIFFLVLANPIGYAKSMCFSKWLQLVSCVHDLVVKNHARIYVHVFTSVFMSQFMGLLNSTQGQTWGDKKH